MLRLPLSRFSMRTFSGILSFFQSVQVISLNSHRFPRCAAMTACLYLLSVGMNSSRKRNSLSIWGLGK